MTADKVLPLSLLGYALLWLIAPLDVRYSLSPFAALMFVMMYLSIFFGVASFNYAAKNKVYTPPVFFYTPGHKKIKKILKLILLLALIGMALRFVDKVLIRDILSYSSAVERRDADTQSSFFGVISAVLYTYALSLPAFFKCVDFSKRQRMKILLLFFIPALEVLFMGSRGLLITSIFMLYIYHGVSGEIKPRKYLVYFLLGALAFYISGFIFMDRLENYGFSPLYSAFNSAYAFTLVPNNYAASLISGDGPISVLSFLFVNAAQYLLHGLLEFSYLIENYNGAHQYGSYTFRVVGKFFSFIGFEVDYNNIITPRHGVYTTLLGPLWVDFGLFSFVFLYILGFAMAHAYRRFAHGNFLFLPLYAYLSTVVFFSPVVNLIQNALGVYVLASCIGVIYLGNILTRRKRWR